MAFNGRVVGVLIPQHITHVRMDKALNFVPVRALGFWRGSWGHPNIEEVECHDGVEKIGDSAFGILFALRGLI